MLAAPKSMTDDELVEAVRVLIREGQARAAERASTQADERLWMLNPLVDGRPMSDLSREQVEHAVGDHLAVARGRGAQNLEDEVLFAHPRGVLDVHGLGHLRELGGRHALEVGEVEHVGEGRVVDFGGRLLRGDVVVLRGGILGSRGGGAARTMWNM